jgi:hypothetical protein
MVSQFQLRRSVPEKQDTRGDSNVLCANCCGLDSLAWYAGWTHPRVTYAQLVKIKVHPRTGHDGPEGGVMGCKETSIRVVSTALEPYLTDTSLAASYKGVPRSVSPCYWTATGQRSHQIARTVTYFLKSLGTVPFLFGPVPPDLE